MKFRIACISVALTALATRGDLLAKWDFNSITGQNFSDASGNGNNGTLYGEYLRVTGIEGNALKFSGNGYAEVPHKPVTNVGRGDFSLLFWIKIDDEDWLKKGCCQIVGKGDGMDDGLAIKYWDGSIIVHIDGGGLWQYSALDNKIADTEWHHVAVTRIRGDVAIHVDRMPCEVKFSYAGIGIPEADSNDPNTTRPWSIAKYGNGAEQYFWGTIDEISFYNSPPEYIEIDDIGDTKQTLPVFSWHPYPSLTSYKLIASTSRLFADTLVKASTQDTSYQPANPLPADTIYWKVTEPGTDAHCSFVSYFIIHKDTLRLNPLRDTENTRPTFSWRTSEVLESYTLLIGTDSSFSAPIISTTLSDSFFTPADALPYGAIWWKVGSPADNAIWSQPSHFRVIPEKVRLLPIERSTNLHPVFRWYRCRYIDSYRLVVSVSPKFADTILATAVEDTFHAPNTDLSGNKEFYWKVGNSVSDSNWSDVSSFGIIVCGRKRVPQDYATLQSAVDWACPGDTIECSVIADGTTIRITDMASLFIEGTNPKAPSVSTKAGFLIERSTVHISGLEIHGEIGPTGGSPQVWTAGYPQPDCPTPGDGGTGMPGIHVITSRVNVIHSQVYGGPGGQAGRAFVCEYSYGCMMPCDEGVPGNQGIGGLFTDSSTVALVGTSIDTFYCAPNSTVQYTELDVASTFSSRSNTMSIHIAAKNGLCRFVIGGNTVRNRIEAAIYDCKGAQLVKKTMTSPEVSLAVRLQSGTYVFQAKQGTYTIRRRFTVVK